MSKLTDLGNLKGGFGRNLDMGNDTYKLRREVMGIIYSLKNEVKLPRIQVRITERNPNGSAGVALQGNRAIWIPESSFGKGETILYEIVLHEIVHAAKNIGHIETCKLMSSRLEHISKEESLRLFKGYFS